MDLVLPKSNKPFGTRNKREVEKAYQRKKEDLISEWRSKYGYGTVAREIDPHLQASYVMEVELPLFRFKDALWLDTIEAKNRYTSMSNEKWRGLRDRVILRCDRTCEGCMDGMVDYVHHLTYENLGDEFLFELIGLCRKCHSRYHGK